MVLSMASLVGFTLCDFGPAIGVLVDRHDREEDNDWCRFNYRSSWCICLLLLHSVWSYPSG